MYCGSCGKSFVRPHYTQVESHPSFYEIPVCPFCYDHDINEDEITQDETKLRKDKI